MSANNQPHNQWTRVISDITRAASGGFLFSIPLLYTMEVWWVGSYINAGRMFIALVVTFGLLFVLNRTSGFQQGQQSGLLDALHQTVQGMTISLICTAGVLFLLRRINADTSLDEALGKVIYESVPFALGVALANQFLSSSRQGQQSGDQGQGAGHSNKGRMYSTFKDMGATSIGAIFIGFTVAPTAEIPMLAASITPPWMLALITFSLLVSYGIVFESGFADAKKRRKQQGVFQRPSSETVVSYLISLMIAAAMLWFFHKLELDDPWHMWLNYSIVLGLPATVGGAAGRIAV